MARRITHAIGRDHICQSSIRSQAAIFATFQCEQLDDERRSRFLRSDFSVDCDTDFHRYTEYYALVMMLAYPIGIPLGYAYLLFGRFRVELNLLRPRALLVKNAAPERAASIAVRGPSSLLEPAPTTPRAGRRPMVPLQQPARPPPSTPSLTAQPAELLR